MRKISILFLALIATTALFASNVITYTATSKLPMAIYLDDSGFRADAFNVAISDHTFVEGQGTITFIGEVTSIGYRAFYNCSSLSSITIPKSVTHIGYMAFSWCSSLSSITIPNSVIGIGYEAFQECTSLSTITIPNNVTSIGEGAFSGCFSLSSIDIPNSVTCIEHAAFASCSSITSITIPNSVTSIGEGAFSDCDSLQSITIPNSVTSIGEGAFFSCHSLQSITIPNSVTSIGEGAFFSCHSLSSITCYATTPPTCGYQCFLFVNESIPVYVPANSITMYQTAAYWNYFTNFQAISAEPTINPVSTVVTTPSDNSVTIIWPAITGANTYTIEVKMNGVTFCTLTFNAQGQLTNIAFAPGRGMNNAVEAATAIAGGYKFTVTSLDPGTNYNYEVDTQDAAGKSIANYTGEFTTTGGTALNQLHDSEFKIQNSKFIRDGQLYILRDGKTYNAQGGEVR